MSIRECRKENDSVTTDTELFVEFGKDAPTLKMKIGILYLAVSNENEEISVKHSFSAFAIDEVLGLMSHFGKKRQPPTAHASQALVLIELLRTPKHNVI